MWFLIVGAFAGALKSITEHGGRIILPSKTEIPCCGSVIILGTLADVLTGGFIGWLSQAPEFFQVFGLGSPSLVLAGCAGIASTAVIGFLLNRFGLSGGLPRGTNKGQVVLLLPPLSRAVVEEAQEIYAEIPRIPPVRF